MVKGLNVSTRRHHSGSILMQSQKMSSNVIPTNHLHVQMVTQAAVTFAKSQKLPYLIRKSVSAKMLFVILNALMCAFIKGILKILPN